MRARRRLRIIASCIAVGVVSLAWTRSHFRYDELRHHSGSIHAPVDPNADPQSLDALWRFDSRTSRLTNTEGNVSFSTSLYQSYDKDKTELESQWSDSLGWHAESWDLEESGDCGCCDGPSGTFWRSPIEWRVAGLGVYSLGEMGEETRIIEIPHWLLTLVAATPGASALFLAARSKRRRARAQCERCAYPLPEADAPCPECGSTSAARA